VPIGPEDRAEVAERWVASYNARDVDALLGLVHPNIELVPATSFVALPGTTYHGYTGLRALLRTSFAKFPGVRVELLRVREALGWLVVTTKFITDPRGGPGASHTATYLMVLEGGRISRLRTFPSDADAVASAGATILTPRERQVFQLLAGGMSAPEVARELVLSPATVRTHVQNGIARLGARTRVQAVALALARGEIKL
jgi:DNA-binding CsgD family transcriptional regulator